jgi:hypothetical protein
MRCDLRDCRLTALSLVGSWLMISAMHTQNRTLDEGAETPGLRKVPAQIVRRASHKERSLPPSIGLSECPKKSDFRYLHLLIAIHVVCSYALALGKSMFRRASDALSIVNSFLPRSEARIPKDVHPLDRPQSHISSNLLCKGTYMCS